MKIICKNRILGCLTARFLILDCWIELLYLHSGIWMVPVFLSLKVPGSGLAYPFGRPKVAPPAVWVWDPVGFN